MTCMVSGDHEGRCVAVLAQGLQLVRCSCLRMSVSIAACSLQLAGCGIVIYVDEDGGKDRQRQVVAAFRAKTAEIAALVVAELRRATPKWAEPPSTMACPDIR